MKDKVDITKFETLEESGVEIHGGFSTSYSGGNDGIWDKLAQLLLKDIDVNGSCPVTNNCSGANCVANCGG